MLLRLMAFVKGMLDSAVLFWLILSALTLVIIGMFLMAYMMLTGDRRKRGGPVSEKCAHFFGYLSSYRGLQSIPEECFGCTLAINCIKAKRGTKENGGEGQPMVAEPVQQ